MLFYSFVNEMLKLAGASDGLIDRHKKTHGRVDYLFSERAGKEKWHSLPTYATDPRYVSSMLDDDRADSKLKMHVRQLYNLAKGTPVGKVNSSKLEGKTYEVRDIGNDQYGCTCNDWRYVGTVTPGHKCKHIREYLSGKGKTASKITDRSANLFDRISDTISKKRQSKADDSERRTGRPYSALLTQGEEPTNYMPINPPPDYPEYIFGRS